MSTQIISSVLSESAALASQAAVKLASEALEDFLSQEESQEILEEVVLDSIANFSASIAEASSSQENLDNFLST